MENEWRMRAQVCRAESGVRGDGRRAKARAECADVNRGVRCCFGSVRQPSGNGSGGELAEGTRAVPRAETLAEQRRISDRTARNRAGSGRNELRHESAEQRG